MRPLSERLSQGIIPNAFFSAIATCRVQVPGLRDYGSGQCLVSGAQCLVPRVEMEDQVFWIKV